MKKRRTVLALSLALCLLSSALPGAKAYTVYGYSEGYAQAEEDGKWGFADGSGNIAIPFQYNSVVSFSLGMAAVNLSGKMGVIRPDGRYLIQPEYDSLLPMAHGLYIAQKGDSWGVVNIVPHLNADGKRTQEVYPIVYASVETGKSGGLDALFLTDKQGGRTVVPLFQLPGVLSAMNVPGSHFLLTRGLLPNYSDVKGADWFSLWADIAYNTGIMSGTGNGLFEPSRAVTVAEALQMAANMDSRYMGDDFHTTAHLSDPWYTDAVNYCLASSIISGTQFDDYARQITRRELAQVFGATQLAKSLPQRNSLVRVMAAVKDVTAADPAAGAIYSLYVKGILTGVDTDLSFCPDNPVTRAEAAALAARLARPEQRVDLFR
ncbi:MAG: hypothetical protein HFF04_01460 [Oscillospiraceae bacterium]|nr:hypothetical protein [Oscillospiraceae bacterium]